jgi:NAD(P)-dependent dehydrogenase (short-subunit alcohol dehydrogenase family)
VARCVVVTGSASGIGRATVERLESAGDRVIGVDLKDADVCADLSTADGRVQMAHEVGALCNGMLDGVAAVAGVAEPPARVVALNFFGAVGTLNGLRPLLAESRAPRAVAVSSMSALRDVDADLLAALAASDDAAAAERVRVLVPVSPASTIGKPPPSGYGTPIVYGTAKRALSQWVRRVAPTPEWAGAGIALNAVAPGTTRTSMTAPLLESAEGARVLDERVPMPLNGVMDADVQARVIAWLLSAGNSHICGQVIYVDGGSDAVLRGDSVW